MGKKKVKISSILLYAVLIFWLLITVIPILWVFENSFKPSEEILLNGVALPKNLDFSNYRSIFSYPDVNMFRSFFNSFLISGGVVAGVVCLGGLAAFGLGRFDSGIGKVVDAGMVACLLVPAFATMEEKPLIEDTGTSISKSFVFLLYQSKFAFNRPFKKRASKPTFVCSDVSHVISLLGNKEG